MYTELRAHQKEQKKRKLKLFFPDGPLEYVAMDTLGLLSKAKQGNQFVVVMIDQYTKLKKAIPTSKTKSMTVAPIFLEHWVANFGIYSKTLTDHGL